jgi:hypothetical protein
MRKLNPTVLALIGGLVILLLIIAYFASGRNPDQDKLTDANLTQERASSPEKRCASKATYDLIKRELFRRAAELRGSDQGAYDKLAAYAVVRMENPVMEGENSDTGAIECSGSLSLDLPPGVAVVGGRRSLMSNIDYTIQPAADGTGDVILLKNADAILAPLATLARVGEQPDQSPVTGAADEAPVEGVDRDVDTAESPGAGPGTSSSSPPSSPGRPSFDCDDARTKGELAVCADSGLSSLDVNMAAQYRRAMSAADPQQRAILQRTRDRFLAYRDSCPSRKCIGDAYVGRMREIRDIMEGRWQPR